MSDSKSRPVIPVWMYVICWLVALPLVAGIEFSPTATLPIWLRALLFLPFLGLTIALLRQRNSASP